MYSYIIFFMGLSVAAAFGPTYLLLRKTAYARYSALLSLVTFQPLLVICVSLLGYRPPEPLRPTYVFATVIAGACLTAFVALRYRREIQESLREAWKSSILILGLVMASMTLATPLLVHLAYIDWSNGEMVNYAYLAHGFLGTLRDPNYFQSFEDSITLRYGAELFLACVSDLSGKAPLMLLDVLSALHKSSAIVAFAVGCDLVRRERGLSRVATMAAGTGFAFATILALNHQLAFLASQAVTGSFVLVSLSFFGSGIKSWRAQVFLALHVLFIVITYSEAMPVLVGAAAIALVEAIWGRRKSVAFAILGIFGGAFLANPWLAVSRLGYLYRLRGVMAGFNVLGSPRDDLTGYLATALGFRYPYLGLPLLSQTLVRIEIVLGLAVVICAFLVAARRLRTSLFLVIPLLLLLMHLNLGLGIQPPGSEFYKSYKLIAELYFYIFFSIAFLLDALLRARTWRGIAVVATVPLFAGSCLLLIGNVFASTRAAAAIRVVPSVYRESDVRRALVPEERSGRPVVFLISDISASFWDLMANYLGVRRELLDRNQAQIIYHNGSPVLIESPIFPQRTLQRPGTKTATAFVGTVIISRIASYSPEPLGVNIRAALNAVAPGLSLRKDRALLDVNAFSVIEGALLYNPTASGMEGALGKRTLSIVGLTPNFGTGSNAVLTFTYFDSLGESDVDHLLININKPARDTDGCYMSYNRNTNQLGLLLDGDKSWDAGILGTDKRIENRNCVIDCANCSTSGARNEFTLRITLRFKPAFAGQKLVSTAVADARNSSTGWQGVGWWDAQ